MARTKQKKRRSGGRSRGVEAKANADLGGHIRSLGLQTIAEYQQWCRDHGFTTALNKAWRERRVERDARKRDAESLATEKEVLEHARSLGLDSVEAYRAWCVEHRLNDSLQKSARQRRKELELQSQEQSRQALHRVRRLTRRPRDTISALFAGELPTDDLRPEYLRTVADFELQLRTTSAHAAFRDLLLCVDRSRANLFDISTPAMSCFPASAGNTWIGGLAALAKRHAGWLQSPETWRPDSHGPRRQFAALVRHLLAQYDLPALFDTAFFTDVDADLQVQWFEHIGGGANLRTAPGLPTVLSKRMAHEALQAPAHFTIPQALRYGQILGQEGPPDLVEAVINTRLGQSFEHEEFWSTFVHWLTRHPMLDTEWIGPMADYLHERKFTAAEDGEPPEPNLSMKSRSLEKLLHQTELWHSRMTRDQRVPTSQWSGCGIGEYLQHERDEDTGLPLVWKVRELTTTKELVAEGKAMNHCVRSYSRTCRTGRKAVYSVQRCLDEGRSERLLTVAVDPHGRRIIQARGRHNASPLGKIAHLSKKSLHDSYRRRLLSTLR